MHEAQERIEAEMGVIYQAEAYSRIKSSCGSTS